MGEKGTSAQSCLLQPRSGVATKPTLEGGRGSHCKRSFEHKQEVKVTFNEVVFGLEI